MNEKNETPKSDKAIAKSDLSRLLARIKKTKLEPNEQLYILARTKGEETDSIERIAIHLSAFELQGLLVDTMFNIREQINGRQKPEKVIRTVIE